MATAVRISLIGAGSVLIGLVLMWWLIVLLVRLSTPRKKVTNQPNTTPTPHISQEESGGKYIAASAAAAVALSLSKAAAAQSFQGDRLTSWQVAHRSRQISQLVSKPFQKGPRS